MEGVAWVPRIGAEFGGYRLDSLIGHGGMSIVYRAQHIRLGRTVALKLLSPQLSEDPSFRERFERESQLAAGLDHPNIIPIFEAGDQDGVFFIAMRYVDGADLKTRLKRDGPLAPERVPPLIAQVAAALDSAHARDLVHRDVKPANILIASEAGPEGADHVYLSDFGVAKDTAAGGGLTRTGMFVGTAEYAAPEQFEGKPLDGRTDIYSLGCVLYESLTGAPAYEQDSEVAMMYAHLLEPPPKATEKRPELPAAIDDVIAKAMAKSRDDRYATGREFAAAVRAALAGGAGMAAQDAPAAPATVLEARPRTGSPPEPTSAGAAPAAPAAAEPAGSRRGRTVAVVAGIAVAAVVGLVAVVLAIVLTGGEESGAEAGPDPAGSPADETPPAEEAPAALVDVLVPTQIARTCTGRAAPAGGAVEVQACTAAEGAPTSAANEFTLSFFADADALERAYADAKAGAEIGRCGATSGERVWIHQATGQRGGRRFCHVDGDSFVIVWTHERLDSEDHVDMLGVAREPGRSPALFGAWWNAVNDNLGKCRPAVSEEACLSTIAQVTGQ